MSIQTDAASGPPPSEAPPIMRVGVLGWIKDNLFNSWLNAVLTFVAGYVAFVFLRLILRFIIVEADWTVISHNLVLFAIGQYPRAQSGRVIASLGIVLALTALTVALWRRSPRVRPVLVGLWLLSPVAIALLLAGIEGSSLLPKVRTQLWSGLMLTLILTVGGIVGSFPLGVLLALGRRSDLIIIKWLCTIYIEVIRGVPLITVLFMAQVMVPLFLHATVEVVIRAMLGIILFSAAYLAENVRGGLQAIPKGQIEAAEALGLGTPLVTMLIVLPQALRIVIPAIVGMFISLFKDTTLVSIVTLLDLLGIAEAALAQNPEFQAHKTEVFVFLACIYFVFSYVMSSAARRIETATSAMGGTRRL